MFGNAVRLFLLLNAPPVELRLFRRGLLLVTLGIALIMLYVHCHRRIGHLVHKLDKGTRLDTPAGTHVLVTGAVGFIGSRVSSSMQQYTQATVTPGRRAIDEMMDNKHVFLDPDHRRETLLTFATMNHLDKTELALQAILGNTDLDQFDVAVTDDFSQDGTQSVMQRHYNIPVLGSEKPMGLTAGWNRAYRYFKHNGYKYWILANNDVLIPDGVVARVVELLHMYPVVSVMSSLKGVGHIHDQAVGKVFNQTSKEMEYFFDTAANFRTVQRMLDGLTSSTTHKVLPHFNGFFFGMNRDIIRAESRKDHLFNSSTINVGNEVDLYMRMNKQGLQIALCTSCFVFHYKATTLTLRGDAREDLTRIRRETFQPTTAARKYMRPVFRARDASRRSFEVIGREAGTDKVTHHGYQRFYPFWMEAYRDKAFNLLEIGMKEGASAKLWREYFPKATLFGIDNNDRVAASDIQIFIGDQSNRQFLHDVIQAVPAGFDIILDDGGHMPDQQMISFEVLFHEGLNPGGLYIIEDTEGSYCNQGDFYGTELHFGVGHAASTIERFKKVVDVINREYHDLAYSALSLVDHDVKMLSFVQNSIIMTKADAGDAPYTDRVYRFAERLVSNYKSTPPPKKSAAIFGSGRASYNWSVS